MFMYRFNYFGTKTGGGTIGCDRLNQSISHIAARFTDEGFKNPTHDKSGKRKTSISKQLKAYHDVDPAVEQQPALPASVFEYLFKDKSSSLNSAIGELTSGVLFYAMRSCEYSSTEGNPKTKLLMLGDISFYKNGKLIKTDRQNSDDVKIILRTQKSGVKNEPAIRRRAPKNHPLCPVRIWAKIVDRIWSYRSSTDDTPINTILVRKKPRLIKASTIRTKIRGAVIKLGESNLGIKASKVGTHSIRTSCATMLSLQGEDSENIKIAGRWNSDQFLKYIRKNTTISSMTTKISTKSNRNLQTMN